MRLLDIFCGAGGASVGYHRAGFDVTGVDLKSQPNYPYEFIQADFSDLDPAWMAEFDAIHASPPCQGYSTLQARWRGRTYPMLVEPVRAALQSTGKPYAIENVPGAPLQNYVVLCGTMFPPLRVLRHRLFESNFPITTPRHRKHPLVHTPDKWTRHYGKTDAWTDFHTVTGGGYGPLAAARDAMGIDWMTRKELNESIPPAYTELVGQYMMHAIERGV